MPGNVGRIKSCSQLTLNVNKSSEKNVLIYILGKVFLIIMSHDEKYQT